ncbi:DMT family transporter [Henriciella aquimarina]|uniref:DMT family transporter n=1 Tax=Henriciella aquimarina TaxID=545261 RepID=UPI000A01CDCA|nr:DMT family transporter [Henriciella aquimarina]
MLTRLLALPVLIAAIAVAMGSGIDALVKGIAPGAGLHHLLAWRFLFGGIIAFAVFRAKKRPWPSAAATRFHTMRGLLQLFCAFTFFYALTQLRLAEATALGFTAALLVAPVARIVIGEKISLVAVGAALLGFGGVALAVWDSSGAGRSLEEANRTLGLVSLFVSTIGYAFVLVFLRLRATKEDATTIAMFTNVVPAIAMLPVTVGLFGFPALSALPLFALLGLLGYSVWFLMTLAYARAPAQQLAPLEYTALIWGAVFGLVFFDELPGWRLWAGAAIIIASCLIVAFDSHFRTRRATRMPASDLPE